VGEKTLSKAYALRPLAYSSSTIVASLKTQEGEGEESDPGEDNAASSAISREFKGRNLTVVYIPKSLIEVTSG
jgi:hypothetical protein